MSVARGDRQYINASNYLFGIIESAASPAKTIHHLAKIDVFIYT